MATSTADGAARAAGVELQTVRPADVLAAIDESTRLVAFDLTAKAADLPALVRSLREAAPRVTLLAYGPHVHEAKLEQARQGGFDVVLSRGAFHRQMGELLARYAAGD
ncbi:hypothetical protein [Botrimarina sp.]|uniref:hypothetical protein n=1 Tax=Botrimarina sp. TaxID=2795802 RepID=UPI0032EE3CF8